MRWPPRIEPNAFAIPFGLAGLADAWRAAGPAVAAARAVANVIFVVSAIVWLVVVAAYAAQGLRQVLTDLRDPVLGAFVRSRRSRRSCWPQRSRRARSPPPECC